MPTGAAIVGGAIISSRASGDAADAGSAGAKLAAQQVRQAGEQARLDALELFPLAQQDLLAGARGAFDIFNQTQQGQQQALSQGNLNAQGTVGSGFNNIQNALLGLPVNQQSFQPQGVDFSAQPQNPFSAAGALGGVGAQTQINTGQGAFAATGDNSRFLNPFAARLDAQGFIQRGQDGTPGVDFSGGQIPGSAAAIRPSSALGGFAFDASKETLAEAMARATRQGGFGIPL